jgi:hypothetical protein
MAHASVHAFHFVLFMTLFVVAQSALSLPKETTPQPLGDTREPPGEIEAITLGDEAITSSDYPEPPLTEPDDTAPPRGPGR